LLGLFLQKIFVYGCIGVLVEFFFTSIWSLAKGNLKGTGYSYIWMPIVYGFTAISLEALSRALPWPFYLKAFLYVPIIYGVEALSGLTLKKLIGHVPWDYEKSRFTPMGLINLRYAPAWLLLALAFDPISTFLNKILKIVVTLP